MTDLEEVATVAAIAADRGGWPDHAVEQITEAEIHAARDRVENGSDADDALLALLGELRQEADT